MSLFNAHDPDFARFNEVLANIYLSLHRLGLNSIADDLNAAIHHFKIAAVSVSSGLFNRLCRSVPWVEVADR